MKLGGRFFWQLIRIIKSHYRLAIHLLFDIFTRTDEPCQDSRNDNDKENDDKGMRDFTLFHGLSI